MAKKITAKDLTECYLVLEKGQALEVSVEAPNTRRHWVDFAFMTSKSAKKPRYGSSIGIYDASVAELAKKLQAAILKSVNEHLAKEKENGA